jgi:UDP-N-acetylmuramyl tripeptide synthase
MKPSMAILGEVVLRRFGVAATYDRVVAAAGRGVGLASRFSRLGSGTSLPGRLAQRVDPGFLARRAAALPEGSVVISGTNGKTTTASMLQTILEAWGVPVVANRSGANLRGGVVSAFVHARGDARAGVFELDEAALPSAVTQLCPRLLVLTNVFRDQLDRFPEPERVALLLRRAAEGMAPGSTVLANADDPQLWAALEDLRPLGFSVAGELEVEERDGVVSEASDTEPPTCFRCGGELRFVRRTMANLGAVRCRGCGWSSPRPDYQATPVAEAGLEASVFELCGEIVTLPLGGIHNVYNAVAAIAAARLLGIDTISAVGALESFQARFGRSEEALFEDRHLWLALVKNPAGAGVVIREVCSDVRVCALVVAVSDRDADGRDVSWIWDADFEGLAGLGIPVVAAGTRAFDAAVRMKYAGRPPHAVEADPLAALEAAVERCPPDGIVAVLATYTAMLDIRQALTGARSARVEDVEP